MNILALDLATKTGWAYWHSESGAESGTANFTPLKGDSGSRFTKFRKWLEWAIQPPPDADKPDIIYYEDVHLRGKGSVVLCGFVCHLAQIASVHGIPIQPVHSLTLKKWATGNGRASKNEMIHEAERRGYSPIDDNEADALMLMEFARDREHKKEAA